MSRRKETKFAKQDQSKTGPKRSEKSLLIKVSEERLPVGLMPPTFPPDYVAGSVVPLSLAGSYVGETPSVLIIDLALTEKGTCPVQWWGMLYEGWILNSDEEGSTVSCTRA